MVDQTMVDEALACADALNGMDVDACLDVLITVLQTRPELAPALVGVACPEMTYPPSSILTAKRAHGKIKSFNETSGFGFIDCPDLKEHFGRDVFVHRKQMVGFSVGQPVNFAIVLNKDNHPQAFDICDHQEGSKGGKSQGKSLEGKGKPSKGDDPFGYGSGRGMDSGYGCMSKGGMDMSYGWHGKGGMDMSYGWGKGAMDMSYGKGKPCGKGAEWGGAPQGKSGGQASPAARLKVPHLSSGKPTLTKGKPRSEASSPDVKEVLGTMGGIIKSFNEKSGYGFIQCEEVAAMGHKDVFLHHAQKNDFGVGDDVQFTAYVNAKGNVQAMDLEGSNSTGGPAAKKARRA